MGHLSTLFPDHFTGNKEDWKKALQLELKIPEVDSKLSKKTLEGVFDILTLHAQGQVIPNLTSWKKASQTYFYFDSSTLTSIIDDLENGVRVFFFYFSLEKANFSELLNLLENHDDAKDIELVLLGASNLIDSTHIKIINQKNGVSAFPVLKTEATHLQELTALTVNLIDWAQKNKTADSVDVFISMDNHFFQSIAKVRAFREIALKIFSELKRDIKMNIVGLVNTREWTLYERYNNMLRNTAAVAAALIGGADNIQSLGYMAPFENETKIHDEAHFERSRRMARNTAHILSLESMLGMVQDAAAGSYHLESLTDFYSEESWKGMQKLIVMNAAQRGEFWNTELLKMRDERLKQFHHRKLILSGINDFPNVNEVLNINEPLVGDSFRLARAFEELRLRVEKLKPFQKQAVRIAFWGDYAALNARLNFTKNYFELLGLKVLEPHHSIQTLGEFKTWMNEGNTKEVIVLCAKDEDYAEIANYITFSETANFIAGKVEIKNIEGIFGGQNIYDVLKNLVKKLESLS